MPKSLLFIPDISGFTQFVQNTEVQHSQHVIAELLEVLVQANNSGLQLAEVEGDALFYYKEERISLEQLLAQVENMFSAFYSHLKLLEKNRICPCNACATAPSLQLKIIAHCGEIEYMQVQGKRKPFGPEVIEVHRLMKNGIESDNYFLLSTALAKELMPTFNYQSKLFRFKTGSALYDGVRLSYFYAHIEKKRLNLKPFTFAKKVVFNKPPQLKTSREFPVSAGTLLEFITNYTYRSYWVEGVDKFEFNPNEVTRLGTEHLCVINGNYFNFTTVIKEGQPGQLIYGEYTTDPPVVDAIYQFYIITPLSKKSCRLDSEIYWRADSVIKKMVLFLFIKRVFKKNLNKTVDKLLSFVAENKDKL